MFQRLLVVGLVLFISACGGGGGGGGDTSPTPTQPTSTANADSATTDEDTSVTINPLTNDTNVAADSLATQTQPGNGSVTVDGSALIYVPDTNFNGSDSFQYSVSGTNGASLTATVTVTVTSVNDAPTAAADSYTLTEDTPTEMSVTANDTDVDDGISSVTIQSNPANGTVQVTGATVTYTPNTDYSGSDSFTYIAVDASGAESGTATVSIEVEPIVATTLDTFALTIPDSGYLSVNNSDFGGTLFTSPPIEIEMPPNTISFVISLTGTDAGDGAGELFVTELTDPSGTDVIPFNDLVGFCRNNICSVLVPRGQDTTLEPGTWQFRVGTIDADLANISLSSLDLNYARRVGPTPDLDATFPGMLTLKPFLASEDIDTNELNLVIAEYVRLANEAGLAVDVQTTTVITDAALRRVSSDFLNAETSSMIAMGDASMVNLFFVDGFSDTPGLVGISGGIPGPQGIQSEYNAVMIDVDATYSAFNLNFYARTTAEIALHETAHFLGLFHTSESDFSHFDAQTDTAECVDTNSNNIADLSECADGLNLMFWTNDLLATKDPLSEQQKKVLYYSPIVTP